MTPIRLIRSLGKIVRGGAGPSQIFLGCLLGVMIGMTPGFNLTLVLGILLFLVLNANFGLMMLSFALGKVLMYAAAPLTYAIGRVIIEDIARGLFAWFANTPVLALMALDRYCLVGGLVVGALVGAGMGVALAWTIVSVRRGALAAQQRSDKVAKAGQNIFMRIFLRLVFGKLKKPLAEALETKGPLLRKSGLTVTIVLVVLIVGGELLLANVFFKGMLRDGLESANGAEVNLASARLSILGGSLAIEDLQITDRDKPSYNVIQLESFKGDINVSDLLAKRFVVAELSVKNPRMDAKRDKKGEVFKDEAEPDESEAGDGTGKGGPGTQPAAGGPAKGGQDAGQEDKATREKKQREQLDAATAEFEKSLRKKMGELADKNVVERIDTQLEKLPDAVRAQAKKKVQAEVKEPLRKWQDDLAGKLAGGLKEQLEKEEKFADYADEALKYRKYTVHLDKARKWLAKRKAAQNSEERKKQLADRAAAEGYLALRADDLLVKRPSWTIRRLAMEGFVLGKAGTYSLVGQNISSRPELGDGPMDVRVKRTDGALPAELKFGFVEGRESLQDGDYYGPHLTVSFTVSLEKIAAGRLPEWASKLSFHCTLKGGLKSTPKLTVETDRAISDLQTNLVENIQAEVTKQVKKAVKNAIGVDLPGIDLLKGKGIKDLLKGKDGKKPDPRDLLKGILGEDKDKDKDKDKKDPLKDAIRRL